MIFEVARLPDRDKIQITITTLSYFEFVFAKRYKAFKTTKFLGYSNSVD